MKVAIRQANYGIGMVPNDVASSGQVQLAKEINAAERSCGKATEAVSERASDGAARGSMSSAEHSKIDISSL